MTRLLLFAGVAGLAITAPVAAERPDRDTRMAMVQQSQDDRAAERKARQEARQKQAEERRQQRAQQTQEARQDRRQQAQEARQQQRAQQAQEARQDRRQQAQEARQQRRAQQAQQVQEQRAQRRLQAQEDRQQRRAQQAQQAQEQRAQRRAQQVQEQRERRAVERQNQRQQAQEARQQRRAQQAQDVREQRRLQRQQQVQDVREQRRAARREQVQEQRQQRRAQRLEQVQDNRSLRRAERIENRRERLGNARDVRETRRIQNLDMARERFEAREAAKLSRQEVQARRLWYRELERRDMREMKRLERQYNYANVGQRIVPQRYSSYVPAYYRDVYYDTPRYYYRYDDDYGYLYRINRGSNIVAALIPIFGGYNVGTPWPSPYRSSYVPIGYRPYYYDTPDHYYRYDGYGIYRINAETQLISALVALVTGQPLQIGSPLPSSYGIYNVPLHYRSTYYDRDDAWYRYGDGFIYQVDPFSREVAARYPIYSDAYYVGSPWPVAYPDYNIPYGYRDAYYDTPEYHYRYANGGIYQVDPKTQVILALASLLTGNQFTIGQPMPSGYDVYNVPFAYRDRYYDTDNEYYRYADGYIYEIDPETGLIENAYPAYA